MVHKKLQKKKMSAKRLGAGEGQTRVSFASVGGKWRAAREGSGTGPLDWHKKKGKSQSHQKRFKKTKKMR